MSYTPRNKARETVAFWLLFLTIAAILLVCWGAIIAVAIAVLHSLHVL